MPRVLTVDDFWELLNIGVSQEYPELAAAHRGTIPMAIPVKAGRISALVVAERGETHADVGRESDRMEGRGTSPDVSEIVQLLASVVTAHVKRITEPSADWSMDEIDKRLTLARKQIRALAAVDERTAKSLGAIARAAGQLGGVL